MPQPTIFRQLLAQHNLIASSQISKPALGTVLRELEAVLLANTPGDVVEFGCYMGTTNLFLRRLLDSYQQSEQRALYAYDSFAGLPPKTSADASGAGEQFQGGALFVRKADFLREFHKAHLAPPITHKAWFKDLRDDQLPAAVAFAFLDGDFYESIIDSLRHVWPRLTPGGVITIDDYQREALPGVERAVQDFFQNKPVSIRQEHHIAIIHQQ